MKYFCPVISVLVATLVCSTAMPAPNGSNHHSHGSGNTTNQTGNPSTIKPNGNGPVIRHMRPGLVPFPQGVDDLQIFPYNHNILVTGSKFISIEQDNTCWRCEFSEDFNHCIQLNQTLCNATINGGECPNTVAILSCVQITENTAAGPIYVHVTPFKRRRPACYIRKGNLRLQPVFDSQIYFLQPKLESCNFVITRHIPTQYVQQPSQPEVR